MPLEHAFCCEECFGPLEVAYDPAFHPDSGGWQQAFPFAACDPTTPASPLVRLGRLSAELGGIELWAKDEGAGYPSRSFKDRVVAPAMAAARAFGVPAVAASSTGNLAMALAAGAARAGLPSILFVPATLEETRKQSIESLGAILVEVEGEYDNANRLATELIGRVPWGVVNADLKPYYLEGARGILLEAWLQMGGALPDHIVVPMAGGGLMTMMGRALGELRAWFPGRVGEVRLHGCQASGCAPIVDAFKAGGDNVKPVRVNSKVHSLAIGDPGDGADALAVIRMSSGRAVASDEAVLDGWMARLARQEGIPTEPAGAVVLAAVESLVRSKEILPGEDVMAVLTASGSEFPRLAAASPRGERLKTPADAGLFLKEVLPRVESMMNAARTSAAP